MSNRNFPHGERLSDMTCRIIRINGCSDGLGITYCMIGLYQLLQGF